MQSAASAVRYHSPMCENLVGRKGGVSELRMLEQLSWGCRNTSLARFLSHTQTQEEFDVEIFTAAAGTIADTKKSGSTALTNTDSGLSGKV
jgi:hypothetical protein